MITKVHCKNKIEFKKGQFMTACEAVNNQYGPKGLAWDNVFCARHPDSDFEVMQVAVNCVTKWEAFDIIVEQNGKCIDEFKYFLDDKFQDKPYYRVKDIIDYLWILYKIDINEMIINGFKHHDKKPENNVLKNYFDSKDYLRDIDFNEKLNFKQK